jgi:coenzyme F420-reducing hydrogenase delta subunit
MKVSGFTFIKNAIIYDYPIVEAIQSILPVCDELVVAVGKSDDDTLGLINSIDKHKVRIVETIWDETQRKGGRVLALETDKAFAAISKDSDWAFYIQGDEALHEKYLEPILHGMKKYKEDKRVDGLLFNYLHFYGSYDYVGDSSKWYPNEIRVVRNNSSIYSFRDAQGFRKGNGEILRVKPIDACIYHYGWVKEPAAMQRKQENFNKYWHEDEWLEKNVAKAAEFDYNNNVSRLTRFDGTHPKVMEERIRLKNWQFDYDISYNRTTGKEKVKSFLKNYFGIDTSYRNYKIIRN